MSHILRKLKRVAEVWIVPLLLMIYMMGEIANARSLNNVHRKNTGKIRKQITSDQATRYDSESRGRRRSQEEQLDTDEESNDDLDLEDDGEDEPNQGPWKVPVPARYQKRGYFLRIDKKLQSLNISFIVVAPKDLPSYVALMDSYGRIVERKRMTLNPHLFGGFKPRTYRVSASWGLARLSGPLVDRYRIEPWLSQFSSEIFYQPGPVGFVIGGDAASSGSRSSTGGESLSAGTLRLGGVFETGWFFRSQSYRWHQVMQAGLALTRYSINTEDSDKVTTGNDRDNAFKTIDRGLGIGPYGMFDSLYMFEHWWWGGRFLVKQETFKQDEIDSLVRLDSGGSHVQVGFAVIGSFTW